MHDDRATELVPPIRRSVGLGLAVAGCAHGLPEDNLVTCVVARVSQVQSSCKPGRQSIGFLNLEPYLEGPINCRWGPQHGMRAKILEHIQSMTY